MLPVAAQTSSTATAPATINQRKENQQDRIANGIQSGELTAGETKHLEKKEADLNQESATCANWTTVTSPLPTALL